MMPYNVRKKGASFQVIKPNGKVMGTHKTRAAAERQRRALYANTKGK